jgi:hypothetical protein
MIVYLAFELASATVENFLATNWGSIASVAGLAASVAALVFARRASTAAKSAREAILRRNLADDMAQANRIASELHNMAEAQKFDYALARCSELQDLCVFIQQRWTDHLTDSSKERCLRAKTQLESVVKVLGRFSKDATLIKAQSFERLVQSCRTVRLIFVEEEAVAVRTVDGSEHGR